MQANFPHAEIRDRSTYEIPHLSFDELEAGRVQVDLQNSEQQEAFHFASELTDELVNASHILVATPMYNWGPPSSLKAWIDRIVNTRTFYTKTSTVRSIPITFIITSGGLYSQGPGVARDHLRPLLREVFTQIGADPNELKFVDCDLTGPIDFGRISAGDPESGYSKAKTKLTEAASRLKE